MQQQEDKATRVALAYEARDRELVAFHETVRLIIVVLTPLVMFLLSLAGGRIAFNTSIYILFGYVVLLYLLVAALSFFTPGVHQCFAEQLGVPHRHAHALGYTSVLQATVVVWLFWLAATQLFDAADLVHTRSLLLSALVLLVSAATVVCTYAVAARPYLALSTHAFVVVFLLCLAFPSADWMPQSHSWSSIVRVGLFFAITLALDISTTIDEISEGGIEQSVDSAADCRPSRLFCVTVGSAALLVYADALRTRRILAQSAWVLVTSGVELIVVGATLCVLAYCLQPSYAPAPAPELPVTMRAVVVVHAENAAARPERRPWQVENAAARPDRRTWSGPAQAISEHRLASNSAFAEHRAAATAASAESSAYQQHKQHYERPQPGYVTDRAPSPPPLAVPLRGGGLPRPSDAFARTDIVVKYDWN
jgi:hypothetical protein